MEEYGEIVEISRTVSEVLSIEWKIDDFLSVLDGRKNIYSTDFIFSSEFWYFSLHLKKLNETQNMASEWLHLNLFRRNEEGPPKSVQFYVAIRGSRGVERSIGGEMEFLGNRFCDVEDLFSRFEMIERETTLMMDGVMNITCVLKMPGAAREVEILQESQQSLKIGEDSKVTLNDHGVVEMLKSLQRLLIEGEDSDCLIRVQGKEFPAHKAILRIRSPVFQAMFAHDMVEQQSGVVTMEDCDPETFPDFLTHVYTGSVDMISTGNVFSLYAASEKYDLPTLKRACGEFVKKNLTIPSFCDAIMMAIKYDDKELLECATEFFCNNALDIIKTAKWQDFLAENPVVGNELHIKQLSK